MPAIRWLSLVVWVTAAFGQVEELYDVNAVERRGKSMQRLISDDPGRALAIALPETELTALRLRFPQAASLIETRGEWEGPLTVTVQDDLERHRSRTAHWIRVGGRSVSLHWPGAPESSCAARVRVRGIRLGDQIAVESVTRLDGATACTVTGEQNVAVLLVNFRTTRLPAWFTPSMANSAFFEAGVSMDQFWRENSFGVTKASGRVFGPFDLEADYDCYATEALLDAAIGAADSSVDLRAYARIFVVAPSTGACWWSGMSTVGCSAVTSSSHGDFTASVSWILIPPAGTRELAAGLVSHESGHGFGLNHSRSLDFDITPLGPPGSVGTRAEYGDMFSNMGTGSGQWPAPHRNVLGWFSSTGNIQQVEAPGTFTLAPYEIRTSSVQALRVRRGQDTEQWLWMEYRQPLGLFDVGANPSAFDAALVHFEDAASPGGTYTDLLDFQPVRKPNDFRMAPLKSGQTWQDPFSPLTLSIGAAGSDGLRVSVAYETPCASLLPARTLFGPQPQTGVIRISARDSCSWTAVSTAYWISVNAGQSGIGSGAVSFSIDRNTSSGPRTGVILVGRQRFLITQQLVWPNLALTVTHSGLFANGGNGTFIMVLRNTGDAPTATAVGISNTPGVGLAVEAISGTGWSCSASDGACWRNDPLAPGQSYPPISITVSVAQGAPSTLVDRASVLLADDSGEASVVATVTAAAQAGGLSATLPSLTVALSHTGTFTRGQPGGTLIATVTNAGAGPTTSSISVAVKPAVGLVPTSISGAGWTCTLSTVSCTRTDPLAGGSSYPPISILVNVAADAPAMLTSSASLSGGGGAETANNPSIDVIRVSVNCRPRRDGLCTWTAPWY